ncbi:MAG: hypothetical protein EOP58_06320 [Sphingomonadales bacterium]|nr:MAG: hypothetical protein EOP58_06320 [Sphingomonadales bacterium]
MSRAPVRALLAAAAIAVAAPVVAQTQPAPAFTPLTAEFDAFVTKTAATPMPERVRLFRARFNALFPGFYTPRGGATEERYNAHVERHLTAYPAQRDKFLAAAHEFAAAYARGTARFRRFFPDYAPTMPIYLVHSLGEMDGGTRQLEGRVVGVFGADVIARIHDSATIGPFLDHELFHFHHVRFFPDCEALWCSLWQEGLAVYVASKMNPGADDKALLLVTPKPIRPEVEPRLAEAICYTRERMESVYPAVYRDYFQGNGGATVFPARFGYYVGYRIAQNFGETRSLEQLAALSPAEAKPLILKAMQNFAACPKG